MIKSIVHIDFDSYFASCEQQFNPTLRGRPIGVTAQNGRTCIIAASREAKKMGIKSPSRTFEALRICPDIQFVPAHFEKYWDITQKFLDICKDYSPYVELFSLDEVFIDLTTTQHLFGGREKVIMEIKKRIRNTIGEYITVSAGLSHNRLLAKLASGMKKPDGFFEIKEEDVDKIYSQIELTALCGIGERVKRRLNKIGVYTPLDLKRIPLSLLIREFKEVEGRFLKNLGEAYDNTPVVPYYLEDSVKSVGRNYCLPQNTYDQRRVLQNIYELCQEVSIKLRRLDKKCRTVGLYLGGNRSMHSRKTLTHHIDTGSDIFMLCKKLYDEWEWDKKGYEQGMVRQISIWCGNLEDTNNLTLPLFEENQKKEKLQQTIDVLNDRFGHRMVRTGFVVDGPNLKTVPNGYMADRYERTRLARNTQF